MNGLKFISFTTNTPLKEVAKLLGVTPQAVNDWVQGRKEIPQKRLSVLADYFGFSEKLLKSELSIKDKIDIEVQLQAEKKTPNESIEKYDSTLVALSVKNELLETQYYSLIDLLEAQSSAFKKLLNDTNDFQRALNDLTQIDSLRLDIDGSEKVYELLAAFQEIRRGVKKMSES